MKLDGWDKSPLDSYAQKRHATTASRRVQFFAIRKDLVRDPTTHATIPTKRKNAPLRYRDIIHASMGPAHGLKFMQLIRRLGVTTCLELGTCGGISSMFLYSALLANAKKKGLRSRYIGIEKCPARAQLTMDSLALVHDQRYGDYQIHPDTFEDGIPKTTKLFDGHLQFCYIDGHHLGVPTMFYFDAVAEAMKSGVICIDDISYNKGMARATKTLTSHERVQRTMRLDSKMFFVLTEVPNGKRRRDVRA